MSSPSASEAEDAKSMSSPASLLRAAESDPAVAALQKGSRPPFPLA